MNPNIIKAGLDSGMLNYMDLETPRYYFLHALATEEELEKFAEIIIQDCLGVLKKRYMGDNNREDMEVKRCIEDIKKHYGLEK